MSNDYVSKELFNTEITNIKKGQDDLKDDINNISKTSHEISKSLVRLESNTDLINTRFKHVEESLDSIRDSIKEHQTKHKSTSAKIYGIKTDIVSIKKYPIYTRWTLGVIISLTVIWNFIFGGGSK